MIELSLIWKKNVKILKKVFKKFCPLKAGCIRLIEFYQKRLSRHTCLYVPTCSEYTKRSVNNLGPLKGILFGLCRILRCNPLSKGGYDPAPERRRAIRWLI